MDNWRSAAAGPNPPLKAPKPLGQAAKGGDLREFSPIPYSEKRAAGYGYGLAQAIVPFPNDRWGLVAYWAYYAPQAEASYRTRYGLLGSSIRHIDQHGAPQIPFAGTASGPSSS